MKTVITYLLAALSCFVVIYPCNALASTAAEVAPVDEADFIFRATHFIVERAKTDGKAAAALKGLLEREKVRDPFKLSPDAIKVAFRYANGNYDELLCYPGGPKVAAGKQAFKCFEAPKSNAKVTAWTSNDYVQYVYMDGAIQLLDPALQLKIHSTPNLKEKAIQVYMSRIMNPSIYAFQATAASFGQRDVAAVFQGQCAPLVKVQVKLGLNGGRYPVFNDGTKKLEELPIAPMLDAMRLAMKDQCADLAGFQLYVTSPANGTRLGSMLAENGWKITDGVAASKNESQLVVDLKLVSSTTTQPKWGATGSTLGTIYNGKCAANAVLPFEQFKGHYLDTLNPNDFSIDNYVENAHRIAKTYALQCPSTESITFHVKAVLPNRYQCIDATKCMVLTKADGWKAGTAGMQQSAPPVQQMAIKDCSASDMFCELEAGDFFNAIYEGNGEKYFLLDEKYLQKKERQRNPNQNVSEAYQQLNEAAAPNAPLTTFPLVMRNYLYAYANTSKSCLQSDHETRPLTKHVSATETPIPTGRKIFGVLQYDTHVTPAYDISSTAEFNKEFAPACDMFCRAEGATSASKFALQGDFGKAQASIVEGLAQLMSRHACNSPEVKQFERNLLHLFQQIYAGKSTSGAQPPIGEALPPPREKLSEFAALAAVRNAKLGTLLVKTKEGDLYSAEMGASGQSCQPGMRKVKLANNEHKAQLAQYEQSIVPQMEKRKAWNDALSKVKAEYEGKSNAVYDRLHEVDRAERASGRMTPQSEAARAVLLKKIKELYDQYVTPLGDQPPLPPPPPAMPIAEVPIVNMVLLVKGAAADAPIVATTPAYVLGKYPEGAMTHYYFIAPQAVAQFNARYFPLVNKYCPTAERVQMSMGFDEVLTQSRTDPGDVRTVISATLYFHKRKDGSWAPEKDELNPRDYEDPKFSRELVEEESFRKDYTIAFGQRNSLEDRYRRFFWLRQDGK